MNELQKTAVDLVNMTKPETNRHKAIHKKDTRRIKKIRGFAQMFN